MSPGPARPLRALALFVGLWIGGRSAFLWATGHGQLPKGAHRPSSAFAAQRTSAPVARVGTREMPLRRMASRAIARRKPAHPWYIAGKLGDSGVHPLPAETPVNPGAAAGRDDAPPESPTALLMPSTVSRNRGWSASIWGISRQGSGGVHGLAKGELGGSQVGARIYRALSPGVALTAGLSTALASRQSEGALGLAVRRGAVSLIAERRFALDRGGRNDWSVTAVAGVADVALPLGIRLDAYAQAGIVGRDGFADGAARVERGLVATKLGRLSLGAGSWASIQPGVARLDVGPQLVARTTLGGHALRISGKWRARMAGNAAPGSGAVVTLGADF